MLPNENEKAPAATEALKENVIDEDNSNMVAQGTPKVNRLLLAGEQLVTSENIWKIAAQLWDAGYYVLPAYKAVPCFRLGKDEHIYDKEHDWFNPANPGGVWFNTVRAPDTLSVWLRNCILVDDDRPKVHKKLEEGKKPSERQLATDPVLAALVDAADLSELFQYGEPSEPSGLRSKHLMYQTTLDKYAAMLRGEFKQAYSGFEFDIKTGNQLVHIKQGKTINLDNLLNAPVVPQEVLNILAAAPKSPNKGTVKKEKGAEEYQSVDDTSWAKPEWILTQEGLRAISKTGNASDARWNIGLQIVAAGFTFEHYASLPFAKELIAQKGIGWLRDTEWENLLNKHDANQEEINAAEFLLDVNKEMGNKVITPSDFIQDGEESGYEPVEFIIENTLPVGLNIIYGESRNYKTFAAIHAAATVAKGTGYYGVNRVQGGAVYWLAAEAPEQVDERLQAWKDEFNDGRPLSNFFIIKNFPDLTKKASWETMKESIKSHAASKSLTPKMVIIDTFTRITRGINEDRKDEVAPILQDARDMAAELKLALVMTHHTNKSEKLSGSQAFYNEADSLYQCKKSSELEFTLHCEKMKSAAEPRDMRFKGVIKEKAERFMKKESISQWTTIPEQGAELHRQEIYGDVKTALAFGGIDLNIGGSPWNKQTEQPKTGDSKNKKIGESVFECLYSLQLKAVTKTEDIRELWQGWVVNDRPQYEELVKESASNFGKALDSLVDAGKLVAGGKQGKSKTYSLNPSYYDSGLKF